MFFIVQTKILKAASLKHYNFKVFDFGFLSDL
jgi:hypothetical protein